MLIARMPVLVMTKMEHVSVLRLRRRLVRDCYQTKLIGTYSGNESSTVGTDNYTISIDAGSDILKIEIDNI